MRIPILWTKIISVPLLLGSCGSFADTKTDTTYTPLTNEQKIRMIDEVLPGLNSEFEQLYIEDVCLTKEMGPWIGGGKNGKRKLQIWNAVVTGVHCDDKGLLKLSRSETSKLCRTKPFEGEWDYRAVCKEVVNFPMTQKAFENFKKTGKPHQIPTSISRCHEALQTLVENQRRQTEVLDRMTGLRGERNRYAGGPESPAKAIERAARPDCAKWRERRDLENLQRMEEEAQSNSTQESP